MPTREPQVLMGSTSWDAGQQNMPLQVYACVRRHLLLGPPVRDSAESESIPMCLQQEAIFQVERVAFLEDGVARTSLCLHFLFLERCLWIGKKQ